MRAVCSTLEYGVAATFEGEPARYSGRMAICIPFAYRGDKVIANPTGRISESSHFVLYHLVAMLGQLLVESLLPSMDSLAIAGSCSDVTSLDNAAAVTVDGDRRTNVNMVRRPLG